MPFRARTSRDTYTRYEMPVGICIPDVLSVVGSWNVKRTPKLRRWTHQHSFLTWALRSRGPLAVDQVAGLAYQSVEKMAELADDLLSCAVLIETSDGNLRLAPRCPLLLAQVWAVELKLTRWRNALEQARQYLDFADIVVVGMDPDGVKRANSACFRELGIGLAAIGRGATRWLVAPRKRRLVELGPDHDYIIGSVLSRRTHTLWSRKKDA